MRNAYKLVDQLEGTTVVLDQLECNMDVIWVSCLLHMTCTLSQLSQAKTRLYFDLWIRTGRAGVERVVPGD